MSKYKNYMNNQQITVDENAYVIPEAENADITHELEVSEPMVGIVVDCPRLNVRVKPHADADVVCIIERDSKVMIDEENSTKNFYKICTEVGIEGYCMKRFINTSI